MNIFLNPAAFFNKPLIVTLLMLDGNFVFFIIIIATEINDVVMCVCVCDKEEEKPELGLFCF